jgi:nucleolar complex protein 2
LVVTTLKYTPVVLGHYLPVKELPSGKLYAESSGTLHPADPVCSKLSTQTKQYGIVQRLVKSYFASFVKLLRQLSDTDMIAIAINESARLIPYMVGNRKVAKDYVNVSLWLRDTGIFH